MTGTKLVSATDNDTPASTITWTLKGTNAKAYKIVGTTTVNVVNAPTDTPELTVDPPDTTGQVARQTIYATCSHSGMLYYVVSQDKAQT